MHKKITVNIAIAAYNAEKNIKRLVESVTMQKEINFKLKKIIVNSDSSKDMTVAIARKIKDARVKVIDSKARAGYAGTMISLIKKNNADILIVLNDDIVISDQFYIEKAIEPILLEENVGLVCCNIIDINTKTFTAKAVKSGYDAFRRLGVSLRNGNNIFTVDGKTLCFTQKFIISIKLPNDLRKMGNVDSYFYLECIKNKFKYRYSKNAILYYRFPSTIDDFINWQTRSFTSTNYILKETFGKLAEEEFKIPFIPFTYYRLLEFFKNPIGCIFIKFIVYYCQYKAYSRKKVFETKWNTVLTTKDI